MSSYLTIEECRKQQQEILENLVDIKDKEEIISMLSDELKDFYDFLKTFNYSYVFTVNRTTSMYSKNKGKIYSEAVISFWLKCFNELKLIRKKRLSGNHLFWIEYSFDHRFLFPRSKLKNVENIKGIADKETIRMIYWAGQENEPVYLKNLLTRSNTTGMSIMEQNKRKGTINALVYKGYIVKYQDSAGKNLYRLSDDIVKGENRYWQPT